MSVECVCVGGGLGPRKQCNSDHTAPTGCFFFSLISILPRFESRLGRIFLQP